ncbi:WD40/YVTN/BNR-like repeat-containing protein [Mariniflexile sp. AS56]|uniref:WD40/YVTN/BNR-like repeat-containing protein n=1 Tax=Mariniflexile sp. AS56 TaxID=3063957 RepID=UPI0026EDE8A1|nr:oxidoreductase [Mariniflexile sp. AS56]MDO7170662.1 oxidoreductase [Mariniflexile sp. AS56]
MKQLCLLMLCALCLVSCGKKEEFKPRHIVNVEIETLLQDSLLSIRALELLNDGSLAFAANNGAFGLYNPLKDSWVTSVQELDSLKLHFRAVAHTATDFFMLSIESPAVLYKTSDTGNMEIVYQENHPKAFYDAMRFWNNQEGIAIGDPTNGCISIIITRNGGETWSKLFCDKLPSAIEGEAAFAASNSNIAIVGDRTWVATGGKASRILYSPDKGDTWQVFETPIVQGVETTGIYSIDFYDALNGFAIGGDYTQPEANSANKIRTTNGGKTWELVAQNENPGYRSCVQYIPNRAGKELVAVGFQGIDYSNDSGASWKHISDESFYTIRFLNDSIAYAAGAGKISKLSFKE